MLAETSRTTMPLDDDGSSAPEVVGWRVAASTNAIAAANAIAAQTSRARRIVFARRAKADASPNGIDVELIPTHFLSRASSRAGRRERPRRGGRAPGATMRGLRHLQRSKVRPRPVRREPRRAGDRIACARPTHGGAA